MNEEKKKTAIFWLKIIGAVVAGILGVLGVGTLSSCGSVTSLSFKSDSVHMYQPNFQYVDSLSIYPYKR